MFRVNRRFVGEVIFLAFVLITFTLLAAYAFYPEVFPRVVFA